MRCLLVFILTLLISTASGVIETSFVKGVPRLNNSLYCDYYFACRSEGETLQWRVGNNVFNYSGQSITGSVFVGSASNCNYTATFLMSMPMSHSFKSALILSCLSNSSIPIVCSDGIVSNLISIPEKEVNVSTKTINNSIYFERLLSQNLVYADNSTCTNIFVCGVNNRFMNVQLGNANFLFSEFDPIGFERNEVQGTSVQQAILIDKEPYSLVVAMFIVDSEVMNVTCGFSPNILVFSSMQCPVTTTPETSDTMESESTSMESESSTVGESSTMASGSSNILPLILGPSITFGVLLVVAVVVIIIIVFYIYYKERLEKANPDPIPVQPMRIPIASEERLKKANPASMPYPPNPPNPPHPLPVVQSTSILIAIQERFKKANPESVSDPIPVQPMRIPIALKESPIDETEFDAEQEKPLRDFSEIKKPKKRMSNIDYDDFFKYVQYIFLTRNENTFNAATTILAAPDVEKTIDQRLTSIDNGVYIGMIGQHRVCLVNETKNNFVKKLKEVIIKYFPNAKYIVFVGRCFGIDKTELKLADIVISKDIHHATEYHSYTERIAPEIRSKFCFFSNAVRGLEVTKYRRAKHFVAKIVSGVNILESHDYRKDALIAISEIYGCEETSGELLSLFKPGIDMGNNTIKHMQVISIGAVSGCANMDTFTKNDEWQFIASRAAFHYVSDKMKHPHVSGKIVYEVKKPKPMRENNIYAELVKYIIITIDKDEFDAVTTYISAQNLNEDIIEMAKDVYIGMVGSNSVGLLYLHNKKKYRVDMKNAIDKYFPHTEYLIHVGGCASMHQSTKLGDVMISKEIYNIHYDGSSYKVKTTKITSDIFCNSHDVEGLQLPGNRTAKHFEVKIFTGTGEFMIHSEYMKIKAIENENNYGYNVIGGDLVELQEEMKIIGKKIHSILINGVCSYNYSRDYDEWDFVASQAAIHYVAAKIKKQ